MSPLFHALRNRTINLRRDGGAALRSLLVPVLLAAFLAGLAAGPAAAGEPYRLGPSDRIGIRVVGWDTVTLAFVEYDALGGEYLVGLDGTVMLPLLGAVEAAGKTPAELAAEMDEALQGRLGLVEPPSASVAVTGYRPVYVVGAVAVPGAYGYAPGLTVQQALALAGGVDQMLEEGADGRSAAIRAAGTLQEIGFDLVRQQIRAARLGAEMEGAEDFALPAEISHPGGAEALTAVTAHERSLFKSRREALERSLAALEDSRTLLQTEIAALKEKQAGQARQLALVREQVGNVESLAERGLVRSPSLVSLQGQLIDLENRGLDTETNVFRARQKIADLERDRVAIEANRRLEVLRDLQQAEAQIEQLLARRETTRQLLVGAEALIAESGEVPEFQIRYRITRDGPAGSEALEASPETRLLPSDVLEVDAIATHESG